MNAIPRLLGHPRTGQACRALTATAVLWLMVPGPARALPTWLPPADAAQAALRESPLWRAAQAERQQGEALARATGASPHDWTPTLSAGQRRDRAAEPGRQRTQEWDLTLEHALRWPGKARAAQALAQAEFDGAGVKQAVAWRDHSLTLLGLYTDWLRDALQARVWLAHSQALQAQADATRRRQALGDASRIDALQTQAAWSQAQGQWLSIDRRARSRAQTLALQFPTLVLPTLPDQDPQPEGTAWSDALAVQGRDHGMGDVLVHHAPWQLAQAATRQAQLRQALSQAERRPDPTLGIGLGQDRSGAERVLHLSVSLPLGSEQRQHQALAAERERQAAEQREADLRQRTLAEHQALHAELQGAHSLWLHARQAQQQLDEQVQALQRGLELGEGSRLEVISTRRWALEQRLVTVNAAVDALSALWRLQIDERALWPAPTSLSESTP